MKKTELAFVSVPGRGHIASTIEFAKRLIDSDERISATVLVTKRPGAPNFNSYVEDLVASNQNIHFIPLPDVDPPPPELIKSMEQFYSVYMENHKSVVKDAIFKYIHLNPSTQLGGLVIDFFCSAMIDVANELAVPAFVFFTSSAAFLGLMLDLPVRHAQVGNEFTISDPESVIPAYFNAVPSRVLPSFVFDKHGGYSSMVNHGRRLKHAKGIIINTFAELEPHAIKSLTFDLGAEAPTIYSVGPMLNFEVEKNPDAERIMKWLNDQPSSSVVFLCFGSGGGFEPPQLAEIAAALEQSGLKFLWSVRAPPAKTFNLKPSEYNNFAEILPEGFIERTKNRGLVCSWAPQLEVLGHKSVGGFVSHCGWNSILESIWNGVPIATWPLYAEQQTNAFELVKELGLAVELTLDYRLQNSDKLVNASEIEKAIKSLMDSKNPVRRRVKEMREKSRKAVVDGCSSYISLRRFIEDVSITQHK